MTARSDIEPTASGWRRVSYTRRCGWVDWGHALPFAARALLRLIFTERDRGMALRRLRVTLDKDPAFVIEFGESSRRFGITVSTNHQWVIKRHLRRPAQESAALAIFMAGSIEFETKQDSLPVKLVSSSGFSAEDLVSNLIGFYAAIRNIPLVRMRQICGEVGVAESYRLWEKHLPGGLGAIKNRTARPILFPTTEGVRTAADTTFPRELSTIRPSRPGGDWVVPDGGFIPDRLARSGAVITVSSVGRVDVDRPGTRAIPRKSTSG